MMAMNATAKRKTNGRAGMTLIEVLISLVIMSILLAALLSLFSKGQRDFFSGSVRADVLEKARTPMSWIGRDANAAHTVGRNARGYFSSSTVLILSLPCLDIDGYVIDDITQYDDVIYVVSNNRLIRYCYPLIGHSYRQGGVKVLADNVVGLAITYYDADENILTSGYTGAAAVKVAYTISVNVGSRNFRQPMSSRFNLRNKATT